MILIADAGSTKIDWCVAIGSDAARSFSSQGVNALMADEEQLHTEFSRALNSLTAAPDAVYYYGAGCVDGEVCDKVCRALRRVLRPREEAPVEVHSDLLGAARALFGTEAGIACILGTGSNTCFFDGVGAADHVPSLGYILGDEGSGAAIGRRLINAAYRRVLPASLREDMEAFLGMDYGAILRRVYSQPAANAFLGSLVPFVSRNLNHESLRRLVADEFRTFFHHTISAYGPVASGLPMRFIGGVAVAFSEILTETAAQLGFVNIDKIEARPIPGLLKFHTHNGNL